MGYLIQSKHLINAFLNGNHRHNTFAGAAQRTWKPVATKCARGSGYQINKTAKNRPKNARDKGTKAYGARKEARTRVYVVIYKRYPAKNARSAIG